MTLTVYPLKTDDPGHPRFPNHPFDWLVGQIDGVDYDVLDSFTVGSEQPGEPSRSYIVQRVRVTYPDSYQPTKVERLVCTCKDFKFNRMFDPSAVDDAVRNVNMNVGRCKHADAVHKSRHGPGRDDGQASLDGS